MKYKYNFDDNRKSNKKKIIFIVVIFIIAIVISSFLFTNSENKIINKIANTIVFPIKKVGSLFANFGKGISTNFADNKKLIAENESLKKEIEELKYKDLETKKILDENDSLKRMLDIKESYKHFKLIFGSIILREHDNWSKTFTINIGEESGVKLNQAVISDKGLVGYISKVNTNTSVVTTILDPTTAVSVNIGTINEPAILKGDSSLKEQNKLKLEYIQIDTTISIGDMLYTSGLGNNYPSTIPVGKIVEIKGNKNDMNRIAIVEPSSSIASLKEVAIVVE